MPAIEEALTAAGRNRSDFEVSGPFFVCTGATEEEIEKAKAGTRKQIAFYASTPAYRPVLEHHGWGELQPELTAMSKQGKWDEMAERIDDDILNTFAVVGEPETLGGEIAERFGGVVDRLTFGGSRSLGEQRWESLRTELQGL